MTQSQISTYSTSAWDEKIQGLGSAFNRMYPGSHPIDLFEISLAVGGNEPLFLNQMQRGSMLVSLNTVLGEDELDGLLPGESREMSLAKHLDVDRMLSEFCEHGIYQHQNPQDENTHPFLHAIMSTKKFGGILKVTRISPVHLEDVIEQAFERRADFSPINAPQEMRNAVRIALNLLDKGEVRVAEKIRGEWVTNQWLKKAVLLSFRINENRLMADGVNRYFDKVDPKFIHFSEEDFKEMGARIVPGAMARHGAYLAPGVIQMPSYVNIGANVGEGTMLDTWVTVGSCAQIGKNCHLSGGVGIGGVLEPLQASPTIIEDNCFIGARSEIVEGVVVEEGSVISMGVYIGQSTKIYNRMTGEISYGRIPAGSVVVAGSLPVKSSQPPFEITHNQYCVVIIKQVDEKTRSKTEINELLRD